MPLYNPTPNHFGRWVGGSARGSVNTHIMRGYSLLTMIGNPGVNFVPSATLGDTWVVLLSDLYTISATVRVSAGRGTHTIIADSPLTDVLIPSPGARSVGSLSHTDGVPSIALEWAGRLLAGDIIRIGSSASTTAIDSASPASNQVSIERHQV